jgi:DinB superfamily
MLNQMPGHLLQLVAQAEDSFASFENWSASRGEGKWTRLQLLGHLIDSAANNHQRFVRALAQPRLDWPGYDQIAHVAVQNYAGADPAISVALWAAYNRHLAHVIGQIAPAGKESTPCAIDGAPAMTLTDLVLDYVAHLEHHLKQLLEGRELKITYSGMPWPPADPNRQWPV